MPDNIMKKFTIVTSGDDRDSPDLIGLEIEQTTAGYQLVQPRRVLAKASLVNLDPTKQKPAFEFKVHDYLGFDWTLSVTDDTSADKMKGTWSNTDTSQPPRITQDDDGVWVATGSGTGEEGDEDARSASAGY